MSYGTSIGHALAVTMFVADKVRRGMFEFVPSREISIQLGIKGPTLVKILQSLHHAGLIETREGARGGVRLARPASELTPKDVFDAIENRRPVFQIDLAFQVKGDIPDRAARTIRSVFDDAATSLESSLASQTIAQLIAKLDG